MIAWIRLGAPGPAVYELGVCIALSVVAHFLTDVLVTVSLKQLDPMPIHSAGAA